MERNIESIGAMKSFGVQLGALLGGGDVIELVGDVGAGKTTMVKGLASGLGIDEDVQSPSFTISRLYEARDELRLVHYDFYRLQDPGIMRDELAESLADPTIVTVIEWAGAVEAILPGDHLQISIISPSETTRQLAIHGGGPRSQKIVELLI